MGLDVYLYHFDGKPEFKNYDEARADFVALNKRINNAKEEAKHWKEDMSDEEYKIAKEKDLTLVKNLCEGTAWSKLDEYGDIEFCETKIEKDSTKDADHMFKIGYFRSSYNGGGINNVLRQNGVMDLYGIFGADNKYNFSPDWNAALENVKKAIADFTPLAAENIACMFIDGIDMVSSEEEAMSKFRKIAEKHKKDGGPFAGSGFSCREGHFYLGKAAIKTLGFIPGKDCLGRPGMYVIYQVEKENNDKQNWYITALQIVQETIEWVLAQPDPQNYYFHWSG
jgi:hypothetical protein